MFDFKPVRKTIELGEYAPEMEEARIRVQVNVTRAMLGRMRAVSAETPLVDFYQLLSELWAEATETGEIVALSVDAIRALADYCNDQDPQLWTWLTGRTWALILEYQVGQKNA